MQENKINIKKVVYSPVVADLFHYGHLQSLLFANALGEYHICGVETDQAVLAYRRKPIATLEERKAILEQLKFIDRVMIQDNMDPTENLRKIHSEFPDAEIILVYGDDWKNIPGAAYLNQIGCSVIQHPYYSRLSTYTILT